MRRTARGRRGVPPSTQDLASGIERRPRRPRALSPGPGGTLRVPPVANPRWTPPRVRVRAPVPAPDRARARAEEAEAEAPDEERDREGPAELRAGTHLPQGARGPPAHRGPVRRGPVRPGLPAHPVPPRPRGDTVRSEAIAHAVPGAPARGSALRPPEAQLPSHPTPLPPRAGAASTRRTPPSRS